MVYMIKAHPVKQGFKTRMSYGEINEVMDMPNLIEVQTSSYERFLNKGLKEILLDMGEIKDYSGKLTLKFTDYSFEKNEDGTYKTKYTVKQCKERDATYAVPYKVKAILENANTSAASGVILGICADNSLAMADACSIAAACAGAREIKAAIYPDGSASVENIVNIINII